MSPSKETLDAIRREGSTVSIIGRDTSSEKEKNSGCWGCLLGVIFIVAAALLLTILSLLAGN